MIIVVASHDRNAPICIDDTDPAATRRAFVTRSPFITRRGKKAIAWVLTTDCGYTESFPQQNWAIEKGKRYVEHGATLVSGRLYVE
jgi:hypothetical protein